MANGMLLLPTVNLEDHAFKLPATAQGVIQLCHCCSDPENAGRQLIDVLYSEPGILLYFLLLSLARTGKQSVTLNEIEDWIVHEGLVQGVGKTGIFEELPAESDLQIKSLLKWRCSKTRKNLRKFLEAFSELNAVQSKRILKCAVDQNLFEELKNCRCETRLTGIPTDVDDVMLPVHQFWMASSKIQNLNRQFKRRLTEEKSRSLKHIAYGASHEINNPLANIASRAQTLMESENRISKRQQLAVIYAQAMRAHEMISDMMLYANPPETIFAYGHLSNAVKQIRSEMFTDLKARDIGLSIREYPDVPTIEFDETQILVALQAMIKNSMIAIGFQGEIRVQIWRRDRGHVGFSVVDSGPGVDESIADEIFEPFFSGREAGRGIGFGLSKAWRIIQLHGGDLELDKKFCGGTRFVAALPICQNRGQKKTSRIDNLRAA